MTNNKVMALHQAIEAHQIKGFLARDEAEALYNFARECALIGPCLEIGSYCGKSAVYLGAACQEANSVLFAVDHHRGSEEHQPGEEYHDAALFDAANQMMDTFPALRKTLDVFGLQDSVVPVVAPSQIVVKKWATPLGLVFIDGGHSHEQALSDCVSWAEKVAPGGLLLIHDIFPDPRDGGQGPYLALQAVVSSGRFIWEATVNSLGALRRISD
jgi:predicted O-methyltransferase YrrM